MVKTGNILKKVAILDWAYIGVIVIIGVTFNFLKTIQELSPNDPSTFAMIIYSILATIVYLILKIFIKK